MSKERGELVKLIVRLTKSEAETVAEFQREAPGVSVRVFEREMRVDRERVPVWIVIVRRKAVKEARTFAEAASAAVSAGLVLLSLFAMADSAWAQGPTCNPYDAGCIVGPSGPSFNPYTQPPAGGPSGNPYVNPGLNPYALPTAESAFVAWFVGEMDQVANHVGFLSIQNLTSLDQTVTVEYTFDEASGRVPLVRQYALAPKARKSIPQHGDPALVNMYYSVTIYFERAGAAHASQRPDASTMLGATEPQVTVLPKP